MAQVERIYWMHGVLQSGAYLHWKALVDKFEVGRRTAFHDMEFLRDRLGAPIDTRRCYGGWYYTDTTYQLPFLALSEREADTLRRTLLAALAHLPPTDAAAAEQLASRLSPYVRGLPVHGGSLPPTGEIFLGGQPRLAPHLLTDSLLAEVRRAVDHRHRLLITYYSAHKDEITERTIQPYKLLNWRGELYVIGYCELRKTERDFALHRILKRTLLEPERAFTVPKTFDVQAYLETAFEMRRGEPLVTVRARFSPYEGRWIKERIVHPSQTLTEEPDGSIVMTLCVSGTAEVKRWLLSYGAEVEVLEPEHLRGEIVTEIKRLLDTYAI